MSYQPTNIESRRIMTETIKTLLQPIQNRLNAATPGPWQTDAFDAGHSKYEMNVWVETPNGDTICDMDGLSRSQNETLAQDDGSADAEFIAAAPTDQARLLAAIAAVERTAQYLDKLADGDRHYANLFRKAVIDALTEAR